MLSCARDGGREVPAGPPVTPIWASTNRDEAAFGDTDAWDPARDAVRNLLHGAGIQV